MKKKDYLIYILALVIIGLFLGEPVYKFLKSAPCSYLLYTGHENRYYWLFNDTIKEKLQLVHSSRNKQNIVYSYKYKNELQFVILEDSSINNVDISKGTNIIVNENNLLDNFKKSYETFTDIELDKMKFYIIECREQLQTYIIKYDNKSLLYNNEMKGKNYSSMLCKINEFAITNEKNKDQILFKATDEPFVCNIVFYQKHNSNFIILLYSILNNDLTLDSPSTYLNLRE